MTTTTLDLERQKTAKEYARIRRRLFVVDLAIGAVYVLAWLAFDWSRAFRETLSTSLTNDWLLVAGFGVVFGGIYLLVNLPLSYYSGFVLPHRYGMSTQSLKGWIGDQIKGGLVGGIIGLLVLEVIYALLRAAPQTWWLWAAGVMLLFSVVLANLAPGGVLVDCTTSSPSLAVEIAETATATG